MTQYLDLQGPHNLANTRINRPFWARFNFGKHLRRCNTGSKESLQVLVRAQQQSKDHFREDNKTSTSGRIVSASASITEVPASEPASKTGLVDG